MIIDRISNAHLYYGVHAKLERVLDYIDITNVEVIPVGRHEIYGERMYVLVQEYNTKSKEHGVWEAHRQYVDFQYVVQGAEGIGYADINHLQQGEYDSNKDFLPLHGEGDLVTVHKGSFMLLMPNDAHMPGLAIGVPAPVKKIVFKIPLI
jgi:YhcH/YjgK/YiaL family protein